MQNNSYYSFSIFSRIEWNIERLIWIAFYKNTRNNKCKIQILPKDIVKEIIKMIGNNSTKSLLSSLWKK